MDLGQQGHGPNHERWLISYADFITLLFAVFVVLFASARMNKQSARQVSESVETALRSGLITFLSKNKATGPVSSLKESGGVRGETGDRQQLAELLPSLAELNEKFRQELKEGKVDVHLESRGLVISLKQAAFFPSGQAEISPDTYPIVDKIADLILSVPNGVRLEGHTDAVPISNSRYRSNWELSAARSIAMLDLFVQKNKVPRQRMSIAGFADTSPLDSNEDADGRAHNRRVDVLILNEPAPASQVSPQTSHN